MVGIKTRQRNPISSIGAIVQNFKSVTTRKINTMQQTLGNKLWQRGYYDRIIRNKASFQRIRQYIQNNPNSWKLDRSHPANQAN
ncbi:MAG: transposase [Leptolyngbyaceae cyanobacterium MO_188.B28]|nr:transposase [Leptolyngbyaceae cyanobacterium MO_188.B28]